MKKLPNLSEEIAAMAKIDSAGASSPANANPSNVVQECKNFNSSAQFEEAPKSKKKCRDKLVHEFRISVSSISYLRFSNQKDFAVKNSLIS